MSALRFDTFDRDAAGKLIVDPAEAAAQREAAAQPETPAPVPAPTRPLQLVDVLPPMPGDVPVRTPRTSRAGLLWLVAAAAVVALLAILLPFPRAAPVRGDVPPTAAATLAPTPADFANGETQPTSLATAPARPRVLPRAVVARFDYRDGDTATAIDAGRPYTPIGQAEGGNWVLIALDTGGQVWVPAAAVDVDLAALPDLSPRPTAIPVPAVAPAQPFVCAAENASYWAAREVSQGGLPVGRVETYSCSSQADAEAQLDGAAAALLASLPQPTPTRGTQR